MPILLYLLMWFSTPHSVVVNWVDALNPSGTTYNVYRASGTCASGGTFTEVGNGVSALTYTDANVPLGNLCYYVTAVNSGLEGLPSNKADAAVRPFAPQTVVVNVN